MRDLTLNKLPERVLARLDIETVFTASRCVIAAERLLLFRKLYGKELAVADVSRLTGIHGKYCEAFLDYLVFLGLLTKRKKLYRNSPLANRHFVENRSIDWTRLWSGECAMNFEALTVLEDAISTGVDWRQLLGGDRKPDYQLVQEDAQWARDFTYALYDLNSADAQILAANLDLSRYQSLLDVGGGSGVMSIALAKVHPHLKACVLDFEFVCEAAREIIQAEQMSTRVGTRVGDMNEAIPSGFDVIMFWNIGYIETSVMKLAYESLPVGGMVVRSCTPPSKSGTPSPMRFMHEYLSVRPRSQAKGSIMSSLKEAGFSSVTYRRISQGLGLITALKGRVHQQMGRRDM